MSATPSFPVHVTVRAKPPMEGLAVCLCFGMQKQNNFNYAVFLDAKGIAEVSGRDILNTFDEERSAFIMDYVDPRCNFTGKITARIMSKSDLDGALKAFEMYGRHFTYPSNYETNLRAAIARGQTSDNFHAEVEAI